MPYGLDSDLLRTLVAVSDSGSVTAAADVVGRTQSAVSMQVKRLEEAVGQPVFVRRARGVDLTPAGEALVRRARPILTLLDQAMDGLSDDIVSGVVRVGIPEEYSQSVLPCLLADFVAAHPDVEVTVRAEPSPTLEAALKVGEIDLSILVVDAGRIEGDVLFYDPTVWATSESHLVHQADPLPVVMYDYDCWWRHLALRILDAQKRAYRIAVTSRSTAGVQAAIAGGLAVGPLGRSLLPPGCRSLGPDEGFKDLPGSSVVLQMATATPNAAAKGMADTIRRTYQDA